MLAFFPLINCNASSIFVPLLSPITSHPLQPTVPTAAPVSLKCGYVTLGAGFHLSGPWFPHLDCL